MDWQSIAALILMAGFVITVVTTIVKFTDRLTKAEGALAASERAEEKADSAEKALADFRVEVARNYATSEMVKAVKNEVVDAINRLGDRFDRILEGRPATARRRPTDS